MKARNTYTPFVSVIMPCKGVDLTLQQNLLSVVEQVYDRFEIVFVTASREDPAHSFIQDFLVSSKFTRASLHVAPLLKSCGQKMGNMLKGLEEASPQSEAYIFLDSDVFIHKNFIREMVSCLDQPQVGTVCGYHLISPQRFTLGSLLRCEWSFGGMLTLATDLNFSIGASTAIKKQVFDRAGIRQRLERTISDTFSFTNGVKALGLKVYFNPECVFITHDDSTMAETMSWSNRLTIISRKYAPKFWLMVFLSFSLSVFLELFAVSMTLIFGFHPIFSAPLAIIPFQLFHAFLVYLLMLHILRPNYPNEYTKIKRLCVPLVLLSIFTPFVMCYNSLHSLWSDRFLWRGVAYRVHGPDQIEVLDGR